MKFRPCIDIHNGKVKQIVGATLTDDTNSPQENFVSDYGADYYAELYKQDNLTGGHIIMLGPDNREQAIKALHAYPGGLQIGGGITPDNAHFYLEQGASHVIVTSFVFRDGAIDFVNLQRIVNAVGRERLVLDLSCREQDGKYYVVTDRWQKFTNYELNTDNLKQLADYCDEFLVHAADVEGKCNGIQHDVVSLLGMYSPITATYAGGICSIDDLDIIKEFGKNVIDVTIGSALDIFGGNLSYRSIVDWFNQNSE